MTSVIWRLHDEPREGEPAAVAGSSKCVVLDRKTWQLLSCRYGRKGLGHGRLRVDKP